MFTSADTTLTLLVSKLPLASGTEASAGGALPSVVLNKPSLPLFNWSRGGLTNLMRSTTAKVRGA